MKNRIINGSKRFKERSKKLDGRGNIICGTRFTNRMHGELRHTNVDRTHPTIGREDGTDGGTTRRVIANNKLLQRDLGDARGQRAECTGGRGRSGVALVCVVLDDDARPH